MVRDQLQHTVTGELSLATFMVKITCRDFLLALPDNILPV
jgi:hypothetical protein